MKHDNWPIVTGASPLDLARRISIYDVARFLAQSGRLLALGGQARSPMGLRTWLFRLVDRSIRAELADDLEVMEARYERMVACGKKPSLTDSQYDELRQIAEAAGPESVERFERMAHMAGQVQPDCAGVQPWLDPVVDGLGAG